MRNSSSIITSIVFISLLSVFSAKAGSAELRDNAPIHHMVVPGDTLWSIASQFLKDPWRWTQVWGLNHEQVKNPHKIYPGDIVVLEKTSDGNRLRIAEEKATVKLSPKIRSEITGISAISSIPAAAIEPFLSQPIVIDKDELKGAPYVLGSGDGRVVLTTGDTIYIKNLPKNQGPIWQIFRSGKALKDPDAEDQVLGYEATYLGDVKVKVFDDISTATITRAVLEIQKGDRLVVSSGTVFNNYAPHAPELFINGRIISVYGGVSETGKGAIVALNKGADDGLEMGHVLAVYRRSQARTLEGGNVTLPDERTGLVFIFRVFDKLSYALVMQSTQSIRMLDAVKTPQFYR